MDRLCLDVEITASVLDEEFSPNQEVSIRVCDGGSTVSDAQLQSGAQPLIECLVDGKICTEVPKLAALQPLWREAVALSNKALQHGTRKRKLANIT